MGVLTLSDIGAAKAAFERSLRGRDEDFEPIDSIEIGDWVNIQVTIEHKLKSEITAPFMEAFLDTQRSFYQLAALVKYRGADIKSLNDQDLDLFQITVKVDDGSAEYFANIAQSIGNIGVAAVNKMSSRQITLLIAGMALLVSGAWGWHAYLESTKEVKIEEIKSEDIKASISAMTFAEKEHTDQFKSVMSELENQNEITRRALDATLTTQDALLKAVGKMEGGAVISGQSLTRAEARDLRSSTRRRATTKIVEERVRVVDVNTSDPMHTVVVLEDQGTLDQMRVAFRDALIDEEERGKVFDALEKRQPIWAQLLVRQVGDEIRSVEIMKVLDQPPQAVAANDGQPD